MNKPKQYWRFHVDSFVNWQFIAKNSDNFLLDFQDSDYNHFIPRYVSVCNSTK